MKLQRFLQFSTRNLAEGPLGTFDNLEKKIKGYNQYIVHNVKNRFLKRKF